MTPRPHRAVDHGDATDREFAGDLFLRLAADGVLVVEWAEAGRIIAGLRDTLDAVTGRLRLVDLLRGSSLDALGRIHPDVADAVVDAAFHEQVSGGRLRRASDELPKYIEAFERARTPPAG
ncbi:hypothetical protein ADK67_16220 [Saccharothrix sp. NRRL B-16348]|uniref:hypothetical protein n=1 Tax=Saccharothrix sp. NRRL B-16348 TaxID=1415542 RepID=UPI0006AE4F19|nr:hypothetical protein [Saccharothrix sp. NRRL B-16348]KOX25916.1 hypothetical protein ADK67_16220 [Saccharothrix sp. NRRL B-16348]